MSVSFVRGKYRAQVRVTGFRPRSKSFDTWKEANEWDVATEAEVRRGVSGGGQYTVGALVRRYREEIGGVKAFGRNKLDVLKKIETHLDNDQAATLTAQRIVRYITKDRRVKGVTAAIDLTYLGSVLKVSRRLWKVDCSLEPVEDAREILKHMGLLGKSKERDRRPTADELTKLKGWFAKHSDSLTPDLIDFIVDSGFRPPSEIERLAWDDLNESDRTIIIRDRKDPTEKVGNDQTVPLLGRSFEIIMAQPRRETGPIFDFKGGTWSTIFPRACRELGIKDLRLYDLRHEAASRLAEMGYTIQEMMLVCGWRNPKMAMRYTHLRARDLHARPRTISAPPSPQSQPSPA